MFEPPIAIITPPDSGPRGEDPRDADGNLIVPAGGGECTTRVGVLNPGEGFIDIGTLTCGRQSWRQLQ